MGLKTLKVSLQLYTPSSMFNPSLKAEHKLHWHVLLQLQMKVIIFVLQKICLKYLNYVLTVCFSEHLCSNLRLDFDYINQDFLCISILGSISRSPTVPNVQTLPAENMLKIIFLLIYLYLFKPQWGQSTATINVSWNKNKRTPCHDTSQSFKAHDLFFHEYEGSQIKNSTS